MRWTRAVSLGFGLLFSVTVSAVAQQASIVGTVTDQTKAVLPGVTVTASELSTGAQAVTTSDARGEYRLPQLNPGIYKLQAELSGFTTVLVPRIELLVGQNATAPITLTLSTVNETLTVSGEAPLVDTTSNQVAGNVNPTQMQELPLLGRNWLELSKMVAGITANTVSTTTPGLAAIHFETNLDGQQVTQKTSQGLGQPKFSRDAIAEFQIVTNMYDITQGRSTGMQIQAITKSGTNQLQGSAYGFFRSDAFNAPDALSNTVLPYKDRLWGGTIGGPIIKDKLHFFFSYEPERTPSTIFQNVQALGQSYSIPDNISQNSYLGRVDYQVSTKDRISVRAAYWDMSDPAQYEYDGAPLSQHHVVNNSSLSTQGTWSRVLSQTLLQEVRLGYNSFFFSYLREPSLATSPEYDFPGLTIGPISWSPQWHTQNYTSARYDLSWHRGGHDLKIGGEYLYAGMWDDWRNNKYGYMTFTSLPADIAARIPASSPLDESTWNLTGLDSIAQRYNINYAKGDDFSYYSPDPQVSLWLGDTWRANSKLTFNYGLRWEDYINVASIPGTLFNSIPITQFQPSTAPTTNIPEYAPGDFGYKDGIHDSLDFSPRAGFVWNVGGKNDFVIRGGSGLYYGINDKAVTKTSRQQSVLYSAQFNNDGLPGFVANPTRGVTTYDQALATNLPQVAVVNSSQFRNPMTWQTSIGFEKQIDAATGVTVDLTHYNLYRAALTIDANLFYDPVTGYNKDPSLGRPNPAWSAVNYRVPTGTGDYTALQSSLTRRLSKHFQGGLTYVLMFAYHDTGTTANNPFNYLDGEYATSASFQRHTVRGWLLYDLPWDVSAGVSYAFGSGNRYNATIASNPYGATVTNRLNLGANGTPANAIVIPTAMLDRWEGPAVIASGVVVPRNAFEGTTYNRLDLRLMKDIKLWRTFKVSLIGEVFNVFDHANYTDFNTLLSATSPATTANFGQPSVADVSRQAQLGFRWTF
jgi:hypothetical protein